MSRVSRMTFKNYKVGRDGLRGFKVRLGNPVFQALGYVPKEFTVTLRLSDGVLELRPVKEVK
jgi:hypothetical protein